MACEDLLLGLPQVEVHLKVEARFVLLKEDSAVAALVALVLNCVHLAEQTHLDLSD